MVQVVISRSSRTRAGRVLMILLLVPLLSGCVDDANDPPADPTVGPSDDDPRIVSEVTAPTWRVGDYWTYKPTEGDDATLVVVRETDQDWHIGTDSEDLSFFHAREEVSNLGAQRKSDLAGSQGSDRVVYFQWPLTDGANWTTTWDGVQRQVTATDNGDRTWTFEAREGDVLAVRYEYDPDARWFTKLDFLAPDGSVAFGWTLQESGNNWTGEVLQWELETVLAFSEPNADTYNVPPKQFEVAEAVTDVWISLQVGCTTGVIIGGVHPADEPAGGRRWSEGCTSPFHLEASLGDKVGTWVADFTWKGNEPAPVDAVVYKRTLERVAME